MVTMAIANVFSIALCEFVWFGEFLNLFLLFTICWCVVMCFRENDLNLRVYFFWLFGIIVMFLLFYFRFLALNYTSYVSSTDLGNHYFYSIKISDNFLYYLFDVATYPPLFHMFIFLLSFVFSDVFLMLKVAILVVSVMVVPFFLLLSKSFIGNGDLESVIAVCLSVITFSCSEPLSEMVGWGGGANLLAFSFTFLFLYFYLRGLRSESKRCLLFCGVCAALVAWTHHPTFLYLCVVVLFSFLFLEVFQRGRVDVLRKHLFVVFVAFVFCLPVVGCYYRFIYSLFFPRSSMLSDVAVFANDFVVFCNNFGRFVYSSWLLLRFSLYSFLLMLVFSFYGFFVVMRRGDVFKRVVVCSLVLSPFVMFLSLIFNVLPFVNVDRVVYYWLVPVFLLFGYGCRSVLRRVRFRWFKVVFVVFVLVLSFVYVYQGCVRLNFAVRYYMVLNDDLVDVFDWLDSNVGDNDFIVSGEYSWSVWLRALKGLNVSYSGRFLWGRFLVYSPYFLVADNYPVGLANPEIGFRVLGGGYEKVFFVDDAFVETYFSPLNGDDVYHFVLSNALVREYSVFNGSSWMRLCEVGFLNGTVVRRSVIVYNDSRFVDLVFEGFYNGSVCRGFSFWVWGSYGRVFSDVDVDGFNVSVRVHVLGTSMSFCSRLSVEELVGNITGFEVVLGHPEYKIPGVRYVVSSNGSYVRVRLRVWNLGRYPRLIRGRVILFDTIQYLYDLNASYILIRSSCIKDVSRLLYFGFEKVYEKADILVLRCASNETL